MFRCGWTPEEVSADGAAEPHQLTGSISAPNPVGPVCQRAFWDSGDCVKNYQSLEFQLEQIYQHKTHIPGDPD